jgi:hypothetical protein
LNTLVNFESALPSINGQFSVGVNSEQAFPTENQVCRHQNSGLTVVKPPAIAITWLVWRTAHA